MALADILRYATGTHTPQEESQPIQSIEEKETEEALGAAQTVETSAESPDSNSGGSLDTNTSQLTAQPEQ